MMLQTDTTEVIGWPREWRDVPHVEPAAFPSQGTYPARDLELATHLSRWHAEAPYHLSASECETMRLTELLALAEPDDAERWERLALGYTDPVGAAWLRIAIAAGYSGIRERDLVCFAGAQEALYATLHALLSPSDHAIVVVPSYQSMETLCRGLCDVSGVALACDAGWSLDIDAVAAAIRVNTRVVIISFPNNPTGKHLERDRFDALVELCRRHGIWLLSDEVYRLLCNRSGGFFITTNPERRRCSTSRSAAI